MTSPRLLLIATVATLWVCVACGGDPVSVEGVRGIVLEPGETLLDRPEAWRVTHYPSTGLPADVAVVGGVTATTGQLHVRAEEWDEGDMLPAPFRHSLEMGPDAKVFRAIPQVAFRPGDVNPVLRHAGRRLQPWRLPGTSHLWRDDEAELIFWWDTANATLSAIGRWPPGEAHMSQGGDERADDSAPRPHDALPETAVPLWQRMTVGSTSRPGLLVPAPTTLALDLAEFDGTSLHVSLAVAERVYRRDDAGRVMQKLWNELPVEFSVGYRVGEETGRLWSRSVSAQDGFVHDRVDLSKLPEGPVTLELSTASGLPTDGAWPFGFWADLAVTGRKAGAPTEGKPHVVIIDLDTLRADRLGCYGYERDTSPRLDDWVAGHATLYKDSVAASNWTLPSTASMLTGLSVLQHGMLRFPHTLQDTTPTLASRLRSAGYQTFATVEGGYVSASFGFDQGFDVFSQHAFQHPRWTEALDWVEQREDERPLFMFLHSYFTHAPWMSDPRFDDPMAPYDGQLAGRDVTHDRVIKPFEAGRLDLTDADKEYVSSLYDASIRRLDDYLMDFIKRLDKIIPPENRLLIITSDHGEELFLRGRVEHGSTLFQELLAVPLIVQYPDRSYGVVENTPASGVDVVPTVLQALQLPIPEELPGHPLRVPQESSRPRIAQHADTAHSIQYKGWKLIVGRVRGQGDGESEEDELQLYDLEADPGETEDIADASPEWVRRLRGMLGEHQQRFRPVGPRPGEEDIDPDVIDDLRRLGYLGDR